MEVNSTGSILLDIKRFEEIAISKILSDTVEKDGSVLFKVQLSCEAWMTEQQLSSYSDLLKSYWTQKPKVNEEKTLEKDESQAASNQKTSVVDKDGNEVNEEDEVTLIAKEEEREEHVVLQPTETPPKKRGRKKRVRKLIDPSTIVRSKRLKENNEKLSASAYHCKHCKKSFHREDVYVAHMLDHDQYDEPTSSSVASPKSQQTDPNPSEDLFELVESENTRKYQCRLCAHVFLDVVEAKRHQKVHDGSAPLYCGHCDKHFVRKDKYTRHLETHKGMKSFQCDTCGRCFASLDSISKHKINSCVSRSILKCSLCESEFVDKLSFDAHEPCHLEGQVEFRCEPCGETFSVKSVFEEHLRSHEMQSFTDQHTCATCGVQFDSQIDYEEHAKAHDSDIYRCHSCNETYNLLEDLEMHYQMSETCLEVICTDCNGQFQCANDLRKHLQDIRKENGEENMQEVQEVCICRFCQRGFHTNAPLLMHLKVHFSEKPKPCEICQESFDTEQKLNIHYKLMHGATAKFPCVECGSIFNEKSQLKKHSKSVHGGESIFKCLPCGRTFYQRLDFNKHTITKQHHKRVIEAGLVDSTQDRVDRVRCPICEKVFTNNRELKRHQYDHQRIQSKPNSERLYNNSAAAVSADATQSGENVPMYYNEAVYNFVDGEHVVLTTGEQQAASNIMNINIDSAGNIGLVYVKSEEEAHVRKSESSRKTTHSEDALSALLKCAEESGGEVIIETKDKGHRSTTLDEEECNEETFLALSEMVKQGKIDLSGLEVIEPS